ncbi:MAG TPA: YigZ family protein [Lachnospiraceae bacterium]|nr:YigZ family protein [Lachnospiraceae bacterium]
MAVWTKTVYQGGAGEITEKKSRFIATVRPVKTEDEALAFIEQMKKKYWDARHNCYAYIIGENQSCVRSSDDGEPQGTAGHPMLDVLMGERLYNVAVVVTRYFGGVLLGTGGLVRAYGGAVREGLENSVLIEKKKGMLVEIMTDYTGIGKLQYLSASEKITVLDTEYADMVRMRVLLEPERLEWFRGTVMDSTSGKAGWTELTEEYYAEVDGRVLVGEELECGEEA